PRSTRFMAAFCTMSPNNSTPAPWRSHVEAEIARRGVGRGEGQQSLAFVRQSHPIRLAQRLEGCDGQGGGVLQPFDSPDASDEAVDQEGALEDHVAMLDGDHPRSIVVTKHQVVEF